MKYIQNGKEIKWLEEDPSPPSKISRISRKYYRSCQYGNLKLAVGDFVLISDLSAGDEDHIDGCEIAEIVHLYDTGDPDEKDPCWLSVQWFTRWSQLPAPAQKALPAGPSPPLPRELVLDARPFNPEVLISTVWDKCEVRVLKPLDDPASQSVPDQTVFLARFALQPKPLRLLPISGTGAGDEGRPQERAANGTPGPAAPRETNGRTPAGNPNRPRGRTPGRTPTSGGRRGKAGKENGEAPATASRQSTPDRGLSRSGRRRRERSYRDLVQGRTTWSDDDSVSVSYNSPNRLVLKLSRLSGDGIRDMLMREDEEEPSPKNATPKRKARKSPSAPATNGRTTPRSSKKTPRDSRENTPSRSAKKTPRASRENTPSRSAKKTPRTSRETTPCRAAKRAASAPDTKSPASGRPATSRSGGTTPVSGKSSRSDTPTAARAGSASPSAGRGTPGSSRRSLVRRPSLATVAEEPSPDAGRGSSSRPPARRLFAAETGARRRRLSVASDSEEEGTARGQRGRGRPRSASARHSEKESSPEGEPDRTPARGRGRAAASPATPSRGRGRGRGGRSVTASPRTPKVTGTPLVPGRAAGCLETPGTPLERARSRLHVAAVPDALPCRENEFFDIYTFVEARLLDGTGGCMYVSGVPGTGKTATMREVVRSLQEAVQTGDLPEFQFVEVNGMRLTDPSRVYCQILSELTGTKAVPEHAAEMLDRRFSQPAGRRQPVLLMVDELDLLWTRKQNVLYNLFDWPSRRHARLIVVAIANTMDLPERIMMNRVSSRLGLTRMTFQPYSFRQLQEIVGSRLRGLDAFDPDAIQLVARKVAAVSGDARRALDICRRATELAERGPVAGRRLASPKKATTCLVTMDHVNAAIQEMFSSPKIMAIRSCPLQARSLLQAVVAEFQRTGLEEARLGRVYEQMAAVCRFEGVTPPSLSETVCLTARLSAVRLLHAQHGRHDLETRLRLNISVDDVSYALQEMPEL